MIGKTSIARHRFWRRTQENYLPKASLLKIIDVRLTGVEDKQKLTNAVESHFQFDGAVRHFTLLPTLGQKPNFKIYLSAILKNDWYFLLNTICIK